MKITEKSPEMPILYMSGYAEEMIAPFGIFEQGIEFMHKPFRPEEVIRTVQRILSEE